jgi:hypothetical protein
VLVIRHFDLFLNIGKGNMVSAEFKNSKLTIMMNNGNKHIFKDLEAETIWNKLEELRYCKQVEVLDAINAYPDRSYRSE